MNRRALLLALAAVSASAPAAACQVTKMAELPVVMVGRRPVITARFGDKDARFILDSGAFYSTMSPAAAAEYGLAITPPLPGFRLSGIGGYSSAAAGTAKNFRFAGVPLPKAEFVVGGSDTGAAGLIGQNILGIGDIEYDLPHGMVRFMKTQGCRKVGLAYWAGTRPVTEVALKRQEAESITPDTIGTVLLNGRKVRAAFDTGAESSLLSLAAAKRAGVSLTSPGVVQAESTSGLGSREVPTWLATFDTIEIGGEAIRHPRISIADIDLSNADMLIGADFFLTHRVFVSNATHMLYFTYEGGPLFGLSPKGAVTAQGEALDLSDKAAAPTDAKGFSRRGAVLAANGKLAEALADFDRACALAPNEGRYFLQRAQARLANHQQAPALADFDRAVNLSPDNADARLARAEAKLTAGDLTGAAAADLAAAQDLAAADRLLAPTSDKRKWLAGLFTAADNQVGAIANYDLWLNSHVVDSGRASALNGRCWARGLLNRELDKALTDCNAALKLRPGNPAFLDSRALVRLRRGELSQALADYDLAVKAMPRNAWSLYARSVAEARAGKPQVAAADRSAALTIDPALAARGKRLGLE